MAFNGSGVFNRLYNWVTDRNDGVPITASRMDGELDGMATGLSTCLTKDGQTTPTANIPLGGFKITNLGDATNDTDALNRQTGDGRYHPIGATTTTDNAVARYNGTVGATQNSGVIIDDTDNITGAATLTLPNTGLHVLDTNASHDLIIAPGSDLTADHTLSLVTGDADRTLTLTGNLAMSGAYNLTLTQTAATNVTLPTTGTLATLAGSESLTNKTLDNTNTVTLKDTLFTLQDDGDATKQLRLQLSGISTGTTRTLTVADASTTIVGTDTTQTLTNKTLTSPVIGTDITVPNTGLKVYDTDSSHKLTIAPGSDLTANRQLTFTTGDADRNVTLTGNLAMSGSFNLTHTVTGNTNVTYPTSGTLAVVGSDNSFSTTQTSTQSGTSTSWAAVSTDTGATAFTALDIYRNSATPAASDFIGKIVFNGVDNAAGKTAYGEIDAQITDTTDTSEDGKVIIRAMTAGSLVDSIIASGVGSSIKGTNTNDSASAGYVGEYTSSTVGSGSSVSLTTATVANVTSISLTAGDWDVWGQVAFDTTATTDFTFMAAGTSRTSTTLPAAGDDTLGRVSMIRVAGAIGTNSDGVFPIHTVRMSLSATTTVYLVARCDFTASTAAAYGFIAARRMR